MADLPRFRFHPDPLATGAVIASDKVCVVCNLARGFICTHESSDDAPVCPWCLADGTAAKKLKTAFGGHCEEFGLAGACWPDEATSEELFRRTPGFESWQGPF